MSWKIDSTLDQFQSSSSLHPGEILSFRPVQIHQDLPLLHQWMHQPHVIPYWNLNLPFEQYRELLEKAWHKPNQTLYIGEVNGVPMSYWEAYWVKGDVLDNYYETHSQDQGIHLLIGDPHYLGKGYAQAFLQILMHRLFLRTETQKLVAEPDQRNRKMIHIFQKCGFVRQKEIDLPDKRATLLFCHRQERNGEGLL